MQKTVKYCAVCNAELPDSKRVVCYRRSCIIERRRELHHRIKHRGKAEIPPRTVWPTNCVVCNKPLNNDESKPSKCCSAKCRKIHNNDMCRQYYWRKKGAGS